MTSDDIQYAIEQTKIVYEPERCIDTFGDTRFDYLLLTEPMDEVNHTRIRRGWIEAERPRIIRPEAYQEIEMEGFSEQSRQFLNWMSSQGLLQALLKYGFKFKRSEASEEILDESIESVSARLVESYQQALEMNSAVICGVDDAWEVCLMKFTVEMIQKSHHINLFDFKRKGLF